MLMPSTGRADQWGLIRDVSRGPDTESVVEDEWPVIRGERCRLGVLSLRDAVGSVRVKDHRNNDIDFKEPFA